MSTTSTPSVFSRHGYDVTSVREQSMRGATDTEIMERARQAFGRVNAVGFDESIAVEALRLQATLLDTGDPLSPRDLFVAATA